MNNAERKSTIYTEYHEKVLHYIFGKIQNTLDAEDLANDVFVKVFEKFDPYDQSKASISTWIYTITRNTVIDYYRKKKIFYELDEAFPTEASTDDLVLHDQMLSSLADALETLDSRVRDIIILHYFSGLNLKTIAEKLDLSYSYTKLLHKTGLASLKRQLQVQNK